MWVDSDPQADLHGETNKKGETAPDRISLPGILDILKAYHDCGFDGYIRPDHGRHLWGEGPGTVRPGYGLYDRAPGIMYLRGCWDMLDREAGKI